MPPKKGKVEPVEAAPPPPPPPVDPAVVAAQQVVKRWEGRCSELELTVSTTQQQLKDMIALKTQRELEVKELTNRVQDLASPKAPEPPVPVKAPPKPVKGKEAPPPPPPPPVVDEEEQKKHAKQVNMLMNAFKRKREKPVVKIVVVEGEEQQVVEEPVIPKPPDIDGDLWKEMLNLRDQRFSHEEQINTMRSNIETVTARKNVLEEMKQLAAYSLEAAQIQLRQLTEAKNGGGAAASNDSAAALLPVAGSTVDNRLTTPQHPAPPKSPSQMVRAK